MYWIGPYRSTWTKNLMECTYEPLFKIKNNEKHMFRTFMIILIKEISSLFINQGLGKLWGLSQTLFMGPPLRNALHNFTFSKETNTKM